MTMRIGDNFDYIEFELTQTPISNDSSLGFSIKVENRSYGFKGEVHEVYFGLRDLEDFVSQLEAMEKSLQGKAALKELSHISEYRSFFMEIFSIDKAGLFCLSLEIQKIGFVAPKPIIQNKLVSNIVFGASSLATILADFKDYLS
jgi:hypothetical protein